MEWEAPAVVLHLRPLGEGDAVATVMTREHGAARGLARGAQSRKNAAIWQPGNLVQVRWVARLEEQLGSFTGEMIHPAAAAVLDDALAVAMLTALCAVAEGSQPEREPHPASFDALVPLLARLPLAEAMLPDLIRWEATLLTDLGYGMDLSSCAVTGSAEHLEFVSPRTGRAVSRAGAGTWAERLLPLPRFLAGDVTATVGDLRDGLRLTGHFLARDAFGLRHLPLPPARRTLYDRIAQRAESMPDV